MSVSKQYARRLETWLLAVGLSACATAQPGTQAVSIPPACAQLLALPDPADRIRQVDQAIDEADRQDSMLAGRATRLRQQRDFAWGVADAAQADAAYGSGGEAAETVERQQLAEGTGLDKAYQTIIDKIKATGGSPLVPWLADMTRIKLELWCGGNTLSRTVLECAFANPREQHQNEVFCSYVLGNGTLHGDDYFQQQQAATQQDFAAQ